MTKRLALVTGGTTGIGAAICKALKAAGYDVAASYIANEDRAKAFAKETGVSVYQWDVSDFEQCAKGVKKVCADFGANVEILVNNAGITRDGMMHKMTPENWNAVITTNLTSCFNMSHAVIEATGLGAALKAVKAITKAAQINAVGYCLGGTLLSIMAASHARDGDDSFRTIALLASQVDFEEAGEIMLFTDESQVAYLEDVMSDQGYLDKQHMAGAFQLLRSNDLIWSRMIKTYLQGEREPLFDLLAWNADATRLPYRMHSEYLRSLFLNNDLAEGRFIVHDAPVALADIRAPIFSVGTQRDHVAPWKSVYKILLLTESEVTFVLTSGGHNAGIVSEPGHKGRSYQIATISTTARYVSPGQWQTTTAEKQGSWWDAWQAWLTEHSSGKTKPPVMGDTKTYTPIEDAPSSYVLVK